LRKRVVKAVSKGPPHPINPTRVAMSSCLFLNALQNRRIAARAGHSGSKTGVMNDGAPPGAGWNG